MPHLMPSPDHTKDELYELARERGIAGRSTMSKQELIEALRAPSGPEDADPDSDDGAGEDGAELDRSPTSGRSIWSGHLSFGLVSIPVGLHSAVEDRRISFRLLDARDGARIRYRKVNERSGEEVEREHIIRGVPVGPSEHVTFTQEELERIPSDSAGLIDVAQFVSPDEVDPALFDRSYFVAPRESGDRAYVVLREAMRRRELVAIARLTLRQREHLAAIRADDSVLVLETLHWPDEIRVPDFEVGDQGVVTEDQIDLADKLIEHLHSSFDPGRYRDTYRERLEEAIEAKLAGKEIELAPDQPQGGEVVDLTEVLRRSLEAQRGRRSA